MNDEVSKIRISKERLDHAVAARQLEIDLFWKRSLFFWGFIAAAFVALAASYGKNPHLAIAVTCFGLICSLSWSLLNRGSKYWYESWEAKVQREELKVMGSLFGKIEQIKEDNRWLKARRYSVSKLLIALSDYVFVLWTAMLAYQVIAGMLWQQVLSLWCPIFVLAFVAFTLVYIVLLLCCCKSSANLASAGKESSG